MEEIIPAIVGLFKSLSKGKAVNWLSFGVIIYMAFSILSIEKDIKGIKENFDNHITDTDEKIDDLGSDFKGLSSDFKELNKRFKNLYEILLKEKTEKK